MHKLSDPNEGPLTLRNERGKVGGPLCTDRHDFNGQRFVCNREEGHDGNHVYKDPGGCRSLSWPQERFEPTVQPRCPSTFGGNRCVRERNHVGEHEDSPEEAMAPVTYWANEAEKPFGKVWADDAATALALLKEETLSHIASRGCATAGMLRALTLVQEVLDRG